MTPLLLTLLISFRTLSIPAVKIDGRHYIQLNDLVKKLSLKKIGSGLYSGHGIQLKITHEKISVDNNQFKVRQRKINRKSYFDAEDLEPVVDKVLKKNTYWDRKKSRYIVSNYPPSVKGLWVKSTKDTVWISIRHNPDLKVSVSEKSNNTFLVTIARGFYKGVKDRGENPIFKNLDIFHTSKGMSIEVEFFQKHSVSVSRKTGLTTLKFYPYSKKSGRTKEKLVIVIDPGHGGKDPGAIGRYGTMEKTINLQIAKKLKRVLEEELGAEVVLTRDRDVFVPLRKRSRLANEVGADLFLSLHCNYERKRRTRGVETYFLSVARTRWERAVENLENGALRYETEEKSEPIDIVKIVLSDMAQAQFLKESQSLAMYVQEQLSRTLKQRNRGVKQAGFYVLVGTYMPAILVEMGFISHPAEEKMLKTPNFQWKIAKGIALGVRKFFENRAKQLTFGYNF